MCFPVIFSHCPVARVIVHAYRSEENVMCQWCWIKRCPWCWIKRCPRCWTYWVHLLKMKRSSVLIPFRTQLHSAVSRGAFLSALTVRGSVWGASIPNVDKLTFALGDVLISNLFLLITWRNLSLYFQQRCWRPNGVTVPPAVFGSWFKCRGWLEC